MTATRTDISESEFNSYEPCRRLFSDDEFSRRYARLDLPDSRCTVVFSWRSEMIEPDVIVDAESMTTWVGVDERLAAVANNGQILFSMTMFSTILTMGLTGLSALRSIDGQPFPRRIIALCELQAVLVNLDGSISTTIDFPDVVTDFSLTDNSLSVSLLDGSTRMFSI